MKLVSEAGFDRIHLGEQVSLFTLSNPEGMHVQICNYGARIVSLFAPGRNGQFEDIVMGFDNFEAYLNNASLYLGASIGPFANRIGGGSFTIEGNRFQLYKNDGDNTLHGASDGFHNVVWRVENKSTDSITLTYKNKGTSYPQIINTTITYRLTADNALNISYLAKSDQPTHINLTHHTYFNLSGDLSRSIDEHELLINASRYTPINLSYLPTGELATVEGPFDFTQRRKIGLGLLSAHPQINIARGYDHNFALNTTAVEDVAACLYDGVSGRKMTIRTSVPGLQFFSGIQSAIATKGKGHIKYDGRNGLCLETQHFPDSPHHVNFPSTLLKPNEIYRSETYYCFEVE